ncbi:unnamed protein product, partial [Tilletia caries]
TQNGHHKPPPTLTSGRSSIKALLPTCRPARRCLPFGFPPLVAVAWLALVVKHAFGLSAPSINAVKSSDASFQTCIYSAQRISWRDGER